MTAEWDERPYHSLDWELKAQYGRKLYKIALNGGMSCPNRDGKIGYGGCIFCSEGGSGDFAPDALVPVKEQIQKAKDLVKNKFPGKQKEGYIAYFQSYTNTYAPVERLEKLFAEAMEDKETEILSIATRPDCLSEEVVELLWKLSRKKPVWVELGLQTVHEETARFIRRGYPLSCFDDAVLRLSRAKIPVIAHVILGLPGEDKEKVLETVDYLNQKKVWGVKLQLLHFLRGTGLEKLLLEGKVRPLSLEEYEELLFAAIARLRPEMVIHRITGDGPKKLLLAPLWSGDKKRVWNRLHQDMKKAGVYQGMDFRKEDKNGKFTERGV